MFFQVLLAGNPMKSWALLNNHKKWIMLPITNPFVFRAFVSKVELVSGNFFILERKKDREVAGWKIVFWADIVQKL